MQAIFLKHLPLSLPCVIAGIASAIAAHPLCAQEISYLKDFKRPATTIKEWLAQVEAGTVQVTKVQLNRTDTGLEIVLDTQDNKPLQVDATQFRAEGNSLIADIPNAVLTLPDGQPFNADNPTNEIATVRVSQLDTNSIGVSVVGKTSLPAQDVTLKTGNLSYSLNSETDEPDEEIVVTGEGQRGYRAPNTTTATKTDTPLRDIPASIDIVPRQLIEDRQVTRIQQATDTVPGVQAAFSYGGLSSSYFFLRGFTTSFTTYRDGFRDFGFLSPYEVAGIERIEILKGPASVLYGQNDPGGIVNVVSKQPLFQPRYSASFTIGNFDTYRPKLDISGPLNPEKTVAYRLNIAHENSGSFRDFNETVSYYIAPAFTWQISKNTKITFLFEFQNFKYTFDRNLPGQPESFRVPIGRFIGEPDFNQATVNSGRASYILEHKFSDNWKFRNAFAAILSGIQNNEIGTDFIADDRRTVNRYIDKSNEFNVNYTLQNELTGKFKMGSIEHQLLVGVELLRYRFKYTFDCSTIDPIDLFNPRYGAKPLEPFTPCFGDEYGTDGLGIYVQDQITLLKNLKLLLGGRFDVARSVDRDLITNAVVLDTTDSAFTPRVGIVYQPIEPISLYFSYARSFNPVLFGRSATNVAFKPEEGEQFEVGVKADLIPNRLSTTLSFYKLAKQNVLVTDPDDDRFSIQTGEQKSRGIEFSLTGTPLAGWNIAAGYAYTDAYISEDTTLPVNDKLAGVPNHQFGLWSTYEIQKGTLKGLGFGLGLYYVSDREASLPNNDVELPSYFRADASIFYRWSNWKVQLNLNNLGNVRYYNSYGGNSVIPQPPFTVLGSISVEF